MMSARTADRWVLLFLAAAAAFVCLPLLQRPRNIPFWMTDLTKTTGFAVSDHISMTRWGQFPFRSPYYGGGYPLYAYPEDGSVSPRFALVLAFGPWAGTKLDYVLTMFLAASGTYVLFRRQFQFSTAAALVSAMAFAFSGAFLFRWLQGWVFSYRSAIFPWFLYFWWRSRADRRHLIACGLITAWLLLDAKYAVIVNRWFVLLWLLLRLDRDGGGRMTDPLEWRRFAVLVAVTAWGGLLAAVKLVPMWPLLSEHLSLGGQGQPVDWRQVLLWGAVALAFVFAPKAARLRSAKGGSRAWVLTAAVVAATLALVLWLCPRDDSSPSAREQRLRDSATGLWLFGQMEVTPRSAVPSPIGYRPEASPVGGLTLALAAAAVLWWPRRTWRWALLAAVLFWIDLAAGAPANLQLSVCRLPLLNVVRNPDARFNMYLAFCLAALAGYGTMAVASWWRSRAMQFLPWALAAATLGVLTWVSWPRYRYMVGLEPPPLGPWGKYYLVRQVGGGQYDWPFPMYKNIGILNWASDFKASGATEVQPRFETLDGPANPFYRGEAYFWKKDGPNEVRFIDSTPLDIRVGVNVRRVDRLDERTLCINQVKDRNWRTDKGTISDRSRTLGVDLTQTGEYEVHLWYVPVLFYWGAGVSCLSLAAGLILILRRRARSGPPLSQPEATADRNR